jgi:hypothetical protein
MERTAEVVHSGWIEKKKKKKLGQLGSINAQIGKGQFKKRFLVLSATELKYFNKQPGGELKGVVSLKELEGAKVVTPSIFELEMHDCTYVLRVEDDSAQKWVDAIEKQLESKETKKTVQWAFSDGTRAFSEVRENDTLNSLVEKLARKRGLVMEEMRIYSSDNMLLPLGTDADDFKGRTLRVKVNGSGKKSPTVPMKSYNSHASSSPTSVKKSAEEVHISNEIDSVRVKPSATEEAKGKNMVIKVELPPGSNQQSTTISVPEDMLIQDVLFKLCRKAHKDPNSCYLYDTRSKSAVENGRPASFLAHKPLKLLEQSVEADAEDLVQDIFRTQQTEEVEAPVAASSPRKGSNMKKSQTLNLLKGMRSPRNK